VPQPGDILCHLVLIQFAITLKGR